MKILIACEFSGIVREAFAKRGHDAWSCDFLPTEIPSPKHVQGDVLPLLKEDWDMLIAHPPCQYLSYAGNRWLNQLGRACNIEKAAEFFMQLYNAPIPKIAVENPRGWMLKTLPASQTIHPYQFGDCVSKATCLWLKNLPPLEHTNVCETFFPNWARNKKGGHSAHDRSRTFQGIADAMAEQWG